MSRRFPLLSWHRVGQVVVFTNDLSCSRDGWGEPLAVLLPYIRWPLRNEVYTIRVVEVRVGTPMFKLVGFDDKEGFLPCWRFQPVRETDISSLQALLNPTPALEPTA